MKIVLSATYKDRVRTLEHDGRAGVIGRTVGGTRADFDLVGDLLVSRQHARLTSEGQCGWLEDIKSKRGTRLNDREIGGEGPQQVFRGDKIQVGETLLTVEDLGVVEPIVVGTSTAREPRPETEPPPGEEPGAVLVPEATSTRMERRLATLCELPPKLAAETTMERRLQLIIEETMALIPKVTRGALLLCDGSPDKLTLGACVPPSRPAVSINLVRRVLSERDAVLWPEVAQDTPEAGSWESIVQNNTTAGIYAPMIWAGETIGVLCVDCTDPATRFSEADRRMARALASYGAMALGQHRAEEERCRQSEFILRLIAGRFPTRLCERMLQSVTEGSMQVGPRHSPVTVLTSDIRGFTRLNEQIGPQRMSELLNEYFPRLIEAVFRNSGVIGSTAGDAIFAVFGSLEPDPDQQANAVRAALAMQEAVAELNAGRAARGASACQIGIGIDHGPVLHGFVGNAERLEYTVIGNAANYASRYCAAAAGGQVLISTAVHAHVWNLVEAEQTTILTRHEGELSAFVVRKMRR